MDSKWSPAQHDTTQCPSLLAHERHSLHVVPLFSETKRMREARTSHIPRKQQQQTAATNGSGFPPTRSLVEAKERKVGLQCDDLRCMCGPEDDDGDAHARARPIAPIVARLVRGADVPPQAAHSPRATADADPGRARARMRSVPSALSSACGAVHPGSGSGRSAGRRRASVSLRVVWMTSRSILRAGSATCSRPPSGRGVSGSQMGPHRGDAREGLREGEGEGG